jgi:hypothetical protein
VVVGTAVGTNDIVGVDEGSGVMVGSAVGLEVIVGWVLGPGVGEEVNNSLRYEV